MAHTVKLDGRAQRYLRLLEDFGHLSPDEADRLCVGVAELVPGAEAATWSSPAPASLAAVRRGAAMVLFGPGVEEGSALEDDWPLLFS